MSTILDALRRGRGRGTPRPHPDDAHADAVLQTLGYGQLGPASQSRRVKRSRTWLMLGVVIALVVGLVYFWSAKVYM